MAPGVSARPRRACRRRQAAGSGGHDDAVARPGKAQDLDGEFLNNVGITGVEQRNVPFEARARGLEARDLWLQHSGAFDQPATRFEAAFTFNGMMGEVGQCAEADKRHQDLPGLAFAPIMHEGTRNLWGDAPARGATPVSPKAG